MKTSRIPTPSKVEKQNDTLIIEIPMNGELIYFPGHFAQHSILPGVIILDWVIELAEKHMGLKAAVPMQLEVIKFKNIVEENVTLTLTITHLVDKNKFRYSLTSEAGEHSSGRVVLEN